MSMYQFDSLHSLTANLIALLPGSVIDCPRDDGPLLLASLLDTDAVSWVKEQGIGEDYYRLTKTQRVNKMACTVVPHLSLPRK